jgi:uncharacterized coiled-coil protein SlyX
MNDYSKTYFHLKKSQSFMNKERLNTDNKSEIKFEKFKKITKTKDNLNIKHRILKKMSQHHYKKNDQYKNQIAKKISKEKYKQENKKITHNKSFNIGRNRQNDLNLQINNTYIPKEKSIKKIKLNNNEIFFDNYDKNLLHRKIYKNNTENNNQLTKINNTTQLEGKKFSNSYFNVVYKKEKGDDFFSRSQNFGNKKNALRRINTNLSVNKDKHNKSIFNIENDFNKSQTNFYSNKKLSNDFFRSKLLINNDYFNNNNNLITETNINKEEINNNNFNSINNCDNSTPINNHKPVKLYKDNNSNNNATFNLPGSFNFHQYFNTIINKTNNYNKRNIINRNYNKNLASIESNNKIYNNCQTQISNTNESDNKLNTLTVNDPKFIDEINGLNNDLENELKKNQTNSKSQKYNTIKRSFDKFIKTINEFFLNNDLHPIFIYLQKILIGYHDVILAFSGENRKLKELNYKLSEQYQKIDKNFIECNKTIKEKQNEIENLEKKISILLNNLTEQKRVNIILKYKLEEMNINNIKNNNFELIDSSTQKIMNEIEKTEQFNKIKNINMNNLDDLDSLYFFDKIYMKPRRAYSHGKNIPFLSINNINK